MSITAQHTAAGLRAWARGVYPLEAGVELLIRSCGGRFAGAGMPWVQAGEDPGWWWVEADQLTDDNLAGFAGGEARLLRIVAARRETRQPVPGHSRAGPPARAAGAGRDRPRQRQPQTRRRSGAGPERLLPGRRRNPNDLQQARQPLPMARAGISEHSRSMASPSRHPASPPPPQPSPLTGTEPLTPDTTDTRVAKLCRLYLDDMPGLTLVNDTRRDIIARRIYDLRRDPTTPPPD